MSCTWESGEKVPQRSLCPLAIQDTQGDVRPKWQSDIPLKIQAAACTSEHTFHTGERNLAVVVWAATFFCPDYKKQYVT